MGKKGVVSVKGKAAGTKQQKQQPDEQQQPDEDSTRANKRGNRKAYKKWEDSWSDSLGTELAALGLKIKTITGDGNCFFRAVGDQIKGDEGLHVSLRHQVMEYIREHQEDYAPFIEDDEPFDRYVARMRKDGMWAGNIELVAASHALKVNFTVYQAGQPRWTINNFDDASTPMLHLSYHDGQHYNSVRIADDPCTGPPLPVSLQGDGVLRRPVPAPGGDTFTYKEVQRVCTSTACTDLVLVKWALKEAGGDCDIAIEKVIERLSHQAEEEAGSDLVASASEALQLEIPPAGNQACASSQTMDGSTQISLPGGEEGAQAQGSNSTEVGLSGSASEQGAGAESGHQVSSTSSARGEQPSALGEQQQGQGEAGHSSSAGKESGRKAASTSKGVRVIKQTGKKEKAPAPNKPCPCGSKKKFKKCCGDVGAAAASAKAAARAAASHVVTGTAAQLGAISI